MSARSRSILAALLALFAVHAHGAVNSFFVSPPELHSKYSSGVETSAAVFGVLPYGGVITGSIVYNSTVPLGCEEFTYPKSDPSKPIVPMIALIKRGVCTFVQKVRNAERAGAACVVVVNDNPTQPTSSIVMGGDASGDNINIPSLLVSNQTGNDILNYLASASDQDTVVMKIAFAMPHPDAHVEWDIIMSPDDNLTQVFLKGFEDLVVNSFRDTQLITPHYYITACAEPLCWAQGYRSWNDKKCAFGGRYCATDPDGVGPATGRDVLKEDIRQKCIYHMSVREGVEVPGALWWRYMGAWVRKCGGSTKDFTADCSKGAAQSVGINWADVATCYETSWVGQPQQLPSSVASIDEDDSYVSRDNSILKAEYAYKSDHGIYRIPMIKINQYEYRGTLSKYGVSNALCAGYDNPPQVCNGEPAASSVSATAVVFIVLAAVVVMVAGALVYRRYLRRELRREMDDQVRNIVAEYMLLHDPVTTKESNDTRPLL